MHIDDIRRRCLSLTAVFRISWLSNLKISAFRSSDQTFCTVPDLTATVNRVQISICRQVVVYALMCCKFS